MHGMKSSYFLKMYITKTYNALATVAAAILNLQNCIVTMHITSSCSLY